MGQKSRGGGSLEGTPFTKPIDSTTRSRNFRTASYDLNDGRDANPIIMQDCTLGSSRLGSFQEPLSRWGNVAVEARITVLQTMCKRRAREESAGFTDDSESRENHIGWYVKKNTRLLDQDPGTHSRHHCS